MPEMVNVRKIKHLEKIENRKKQFEQGFYWMSFKLNELDVKKLTIQTDLKIYIMNIYHCFFFF